eukprot:Em0019g395a
MRLRYLYRDVPAKKSKFRRKSAYKPGQTDNKTLESVIEEMRSNLSALPYEQSGNCGNLTRTERVALDALSNDNTIVINKADKANVIVIQNHDDYAREGFQHLGDAKVYKKLTHDTTMEVDLLVTHFVDKLYKDGLINKDMADFCLPGKRVRTARIYFLKKTHKTPMGIRPIVSGINSPTEQLSECVDIWLQPLMCQLPSYVRDSTQFINVLEGLTFPPECLLASIDVTSLYTNIIHREGIECSVSALQHSYSTDPDQPPPEVIGEMINIILTNNVIEFEGQIYLQLQGCAMGTKCAPAYASIFMGHVEKTLQVMAGDKVLLWRRFIDDIFLVYGGTREQFNQYMAEINGIHPTIKFTSECSDEQVTFLDVAVHKGERFKQNGVLDVKTYIKPTNKQMYVHATSYHPKGTGKGIVIGEALRYLRTNSSETCFSQAIAKHKRVLKTRGYNSMVTNKLLEPITFDERQTTLIPKAVHRDANPPLTFVTTYNDVVPKVRKVIHDLWPLLHADRDLIPLFPEPPILALKRNGTIANKVVKSKPAPIFSSQSTPNEITIVSTSSALVGDHSGHMHPIGSNQTTQGCVKKARMDVLHNSAKVKTMMPSLPTEPIGNSGNTCTWVDPTLYQPRLTRIPLPYLSREGAALGMYQPSYAGIALGSNQPKLTPKANLSREGEVVGAYQPIANFSQGEPICGINLPELTPKANLSPEGEVVGAYQPRANSSQGELNCGINLPELIPKANLSPGGEMIGAYQPKANSSQKSPVCGINVPQLTPKANLSPEGEILGAYQPKTNSTQEGTICEIKLIKLTPNAQLNPEPEDPQISINTQGHQTGQYVTQDVLNPEPRETKTLVWLAETMNHGEGADDIDVLTHPPVDQQPCCSKSLPPYRALPRPHLTERGTVTKCGSPLCTLCPILLTNTSVRSRLSRRQHYIYGQFTCHTRRLVYLLQCAKCHKQYVGQTINSLAQRASRHLQVIRQKGCMKLQLHFNNDGHTPKDVRFLPLATVSDDLTPSEAEIQLKSVETMWIQRLGSMQPIGLNYILVDTETRVTQQK